MREIAVIGASAGIGLATVKAGLAAGYRVRAFARQAQGVQLDSPLLTKIDGDARDASSLLPAVTGVDAVILSLGVPMNLQLLTGPITLFSAATRVVLDTMTQANVNRLITVTGFGAGDSAASISRWQRPAFNLVFGRAYADKTLQEQLIKDSTLDWTITRPGVLTNGGKHNYRVMVTANEWCNGVISRASVADFLIRQIEPGALSRQSPVLIK